VLISFSSPYVVSEMPSANVHLLAWSSLGSHSEAAAAALFGASDIGGRLPISIPGMYQRGHGISLNKSILRSDRPEVSGLSSERLYAVDQIMNRAIQDSVFPGGVVAIVRNGLLVYNQAFGYHDYRKRRPVRANDIYDLASLTKPMATTAAVMMLVDEGKLSLDMPVSRFIPAWNSGNKAKVTLEQLLNHTSGLPAFRTFNDHLGSPERLRNAVFQEPLVHSPGERVLYSDLGFIILGEIVAMASGESFDQFLNRRLYYPMGMSDTIFRPSRRGRWTTNRIPPTEIDTELRKKTIQAEVHDERAYYLGGIAGHAGLFSTGSDVARFSQMMLQNGFYNNQRFISEETIARFTARADSQQTRALGFDFKSLAGFTTAGQLAGKHTYGHLGFTGTSLWIDPEQNMAVIVLTNRTWPQRKPAAKINQVRSAVMDAVFEAIQE
ncbi:MAG: serine hydrolase, partial [Balneolales bacterium]|nr:serine hydrolase [Balneolales bacterium]